MLVDRQRGGSASDEARVKADSLTPASPNQGFVDLPVFSKRLVSRAIEHGFALGGEAMPRHDLNSGSWLLIGRQ